MTVLSTTLVVTVPQLTRLSADAWRSVAPRLPYGNRVPAKVCADHLSDEEQMRLALRPHEVTAQQLRPRLQLVGIGERVVKLNSPNCAQAFEIGLLPDQSSKLLREETMMTLSMEAPSLRLLAEDLFNSPRGEAIRLDLLELQRTLSTEALELLPRIQEELASVLNASNARELLSDPIILASLKGAISAELINRVEWDQLLGEVGESKELDRLLNLATKHVKGWDVLKSVAAGANKGWDQGKSDLSSEYTRLNKDGLWLFDSMLCASRAGVVGIGLAKPYMAPVMGLITSWMGGTSELCSQIGESGKGIFKSAIKMGTGNFAKQSYESLKREGDVATSEAKKLVVSAWERAQGGVRLKGLWLALASNEDLKSYVVKHYGLPAWDSLIEAVWSLSQSPQVEGLINRATDQLKAIGKRALSAVILDQEGKGPNPLLLSVIQEQLSGELRPVIHVTPSEAGGKRVSPGYLFVHSTLKKGEL